MKDLRLLQKITQSIKTDKSQEFFSDLFIPSEIQFEMEKSKKLWLVEGKYKNINVQVITNKKNNDQFILQLIGRIFTMLKMMKWNKQIKVVILDSKKKRKFKKDNIGRREINGGYTWRGSGEIYIFREQESKKVLLHELIHTFDVDYKIEQDMCESHAELWANNECNI